MLCGILHLRSYFHCESLKLMGDGILPEYGEESCEFRGRCGVSLAILSR
jgi:hypothetical protein